MNDDKTSTASVGANRRGLLRGIGLTVGAAGLTTLTAKSAIADTAASLEPATGAALQALTKKLAAIPRRRNFKTVPMILTTEDLWDSEALNAVIHYKGSRKQVWDNTDINGPWLNLMRNSINAQVWSWKHPDFLAVSATHGSAHLALYDQTIWDKYGLASFTGGKFASNTLAIAPASTTPIDDFQNPNGSFSPAGGDTIPILQSRGVVFIGCHNAIWEFSGALLKKGTNPDNLSHPALAAELTNHLIPGVVLSPGVVGTIPELQATGFAYNS